MLPSMQTPSWLNHEGDHHFSSTPPLKDEKEKTIPFLRQLTEMLQNNEELISFVPGQRLPNETTQGRIIVHDRNRVQAEVLPVYFNHASFASLRRQLSYFSFVRVGKSRQSGVTYTNDSVVDVSDIRKLKRRVVGKAGAAVKQQQQQPKKKQQVQPAQQQQQQFQLQPRQHQEQQQQPKQERPLTTTSADVASAVLSGTLHAAKTNHNLDINQHNNGTGQSSASGTSPIHHRSSITQSSISQSFESSSSGSSEGEGKASTTAGKNNLPPSNTKPKARKRRAPVPKPCIPRKDRARFDKLLSINNIVPFIHLPAGHTFVSSSRSGSKKEGPPMSAAMGGGRSIKREMGPLQKENTPKRDRALS
eukprot:CAMPEP_0181119624 /NCGR_PEP_ID=MMETSP1071-20121207/23700_1 /TAXON_ID=35127 /ORGANISM="Thalassiosira sp., Strain NH16" /LENGTH=361 /DNA_ID=CAMNT_0023204181 /DNA_START=45 /DNA_END=1127 /DNA_ORIENTATION=-